MPGYDVEIMNALKANDDNLNEIAVGLACAAGGGTDVEITLKDLQDKDGVNISLTINGSDGLNTGALYALTRDSQNKENQSQILPLPAKKMDEQKKAAAQQAQRS